MKTKKKKTKVVRRFAVFKLSFNSLFFNYFLFQNTKGGIESPSSSKISDDQACSSKFTDEKNKKMKLNNGTSIKKVENGVMNDSDDSADLDDDAMMKLDEALAQQFKLRKKDKKHESFLLQYKLRALDFIQELLKTTYRLDLITVT